MAILFLSASLVFPFICLDTEVDTSALIPTPAVLPLLFYCLLLACQSSTTKTSWPPFICWLPWWNDSSPNWICLRMWRLKSWLWRWASGIIFGAFACRCKHACVLVKSIRFPLRRRSAREGSSPTRRRKFSQKTGEQNVVRRLFGRCAKAHVVFWLFQQTRLLRLSRQHSRWVKKSFPHLTCWLSATQHCSPKWPLRLFGFPRGGSHRPTAEAGGSRGQHGEAGITRRGNHLGCWERGILSWI